MCKKETIGILKTVLLISIWSSTINSVVKCQVSSRENG